MARQLQRESEAVAPLTTAFEPTASALDTSALLNELQGSATKKEVIYWRCKFCNRRGPTTNKKNAGCSPVRCDKAGNILGR